MESNISKESIKRFLEGKLSDLKYVQDRITNLIEDVNNTDDSDVVNLISKRGLALSYLDIHTEAIRDLRFAISSGNSDPRLAVKLAQITLKSGNHREALNILNELTARVNKMDNDIKWFYYHTSGMARLANSEVEEAKKLFETAVELEPNNRSSVILKAIQDFKSGNLSEESRESLVKQGFLIDTLDDADFGSDSLVLLGNEMGRDAR